MNSLLSKKVSLIVLITIIAGSFASCKKEELKPIRSSIEYSQLSATSPYASTFVDAKGVSTVDFTTGNTRHKMFQAINAYASSGTTVSLDAAVLKNMFSNSASPFTGTYASLNSTGIQLRNVTASSRSVAESDAVRAKFDTYFSEMAAISLSSGQTAQKGQAGKLGSRLVDAKGMEVSQLIQKSLIGALQLDYIGNVLLNTGLEADNTKELSGKNYTQLEQNWDEAYAVLTLNPIYLAGSTDAAKGTAEFALGSYIWEYNKANYSKIYPAFLKGRAAIANNDRSELKAQANFIRAQFETAIAAAAVGYLQKWGTRSTDADRAHDIGEGAGFIYSLRFCTLNGADAAFSDNILTGLLSSTGGLWDITPAKIEAASTAIKTKFKL